MSVRYFLMARAIKEGSSRWKKPFQGRKINELRQKLCGVKKRKSSTCLHHDGQNEVLGRMVKINLYCSKTIFRHARFLICLESVLNDIINEIYYQTFFFSVNSFNALETSLLAEKRIRSLLLFLCLNISLFNRNRSKQFTMRNFYAGWSMMRLTWSFQKIYFRKNVLHHWFFIFVGKFLCLKLS